MDNFITKVGMYIAITTISSDIIKSYKTYNRSKLRTLLKYKDYYVVRSKGYNEDNFNLLMEDIEDGLK